MLQHILPPQGLSFPKLKGWNTKSTEFPIGLKKLGTTLHSLIEAFFWSAWVAQWISVCFQLRS